MNLVWCKRGQFAVEFGELIPAQWVIEFRGVRPSRHTEFTVAYSPFVLQMVDVE